MTVIPEVSDKEWVRVRGLAMFELGPGGVGVEELSFEEQLQLLLEQNEAGFVEETISDYGTNEGTLPAWGGYKQIEVNPNPRRRAHRPEVSEGTARELEAIVDELYAGPVGNLSFDRQLELLNDKLVRFYRRFSCHLE
jgi:hypothetical protein